MYANMEHAEIIRKMTEEFDEVCIPGNFKPDTVYKHSENVFYIHHKEILSGVSCSQHVCDSISK